MDSGRLALSKLLCLLFFGPSVTTRTLTWVFPSTEGCLGSLTAPLELFPQSRPIYHIKKGHYFK